MMDITKSREEFEAWLEEVHVLYGEDIDWQSERNCYRIFGIHLAWCAWVASRESIEVDLPEDGIVLSWKGKSHKKTELEAISDCRKILRTAGIRIKGESE